jgi:hypothetical protein
LIQAGGGEAVASGGQNVDNELLAHLEVDDDQNLG